MKFAEKDVLRKLGSGVSIESVCQQLELSPEAFDAWWRQTIESRVPPIAGTAFCAGVAEPVDIDRDEFGIPHIYAANDTDLFFGFGYAMAQDRLFQLDYLRRKGHGRLSEILGSAGVEQDTIARTVGLARIARAEWHQLPDETRQLLTAFTAGVNALIDDSRERLPIEFDLLDYTPEPWSELDCVAIECEFRWYLTGRFPVIVMPELAKRVLGTGHLYREFLLGEADEEAILTPDMYPRQLPASAVSAHDSGELERVGQAVGDPDATTGSNNWVVSGDRCATGQPMVASDPHIAFEAVSCWYQAHLCGGSFNVAGMSYVGIPAIMAGRTKKAAWGITNNICSQRDLYQEQSDPAHPDCFLFDGKWEPARELTETINVRDAEPIQKTIRFSRNGPIVDDILPCPGDTTGPVSLKWLGAHQGGWLTAMLAMNRSQSVDELRNATRPWHVPAFNLVLADTAGHIGMQSAGRIPVRTRAERGYRPGWDPEHQWTGLIPFAAMPHAVDPQRGWIASANNRLAGDDYPYPLFGTWVSGHRARRIRQMIETTSDNVKFTRDSFRDMQQDALSLRAVSCVPELLSVVRASDAPRIQEAVDILSEWNCRSHPDSVAATIFNVFFTHWSQTVADERFDGPTAELLAKGAEGIAARLLRADPANWFADGNREDKITSAFAHAIDNLENRLGPAMNEWTWGRLHRMSLKHVLSSIGDLSHLLDHGGQPVRGDMVTVCNTGSGPDWSAATGAGYRMIAELSDPNVGLWAVDGQSQSGHPGSPHYSDQFERWISGEYHFLSLADRDADTSARHKLSLKPASE